MQTPNPQANRIYVSKMTSKEHLEALIRSLRPVRFNRPLVRIGDSSDGGYLVVDDLQGITACYSPGVGSASSFENHLLRKYGVPSHVADGTIEDPGSTSFKSFTPKNLGLMSQENVISLASWVENTGGFATGEDLILQMDIEGAEYEVLLSTDELLLQKFRHIIIEFHDLESWGSPHFFNLVKLCFDKLLKSHFVAHIHPNNCCGIGNLHEIEIPRVIEMSFIRKDRVLPMTYRAEFPHSLDSPNLQDRADLKLPESWYYQRPKQIPKEFEFLSHVSGVLHIGANTGQERQIYDFFGLRVIWFEPIPLVFDLLKHNIKSLPLQKAYPYLLLSEKNQLTKLHVSNNGGASSSIYDFGQHKDIWPEVGYIGDIEVLSWTLAELFESDVINIHHYDSIILDTQGSELEVLKGAGEHLKNFRYIKTEAADFPSYVGGCTLEELSTHLKELGFREVNRKQFAEHPKQGAYFDVLYERTA
jgi:FkbM family methyltransferase